LARLFKGFQHLCRPRAYSNVLRQIDPADYAVRIDEELRRARDVRSLGPCALMQHIVPPNDFRLWIGQKRVRVAEFLALAPIDLRRVHANPDDLNPVGFKFRKAALKTPQLGVA